MNEQIMKKKIIQNNYYFSSCFFIKTIKDDALFVIIISDRIRDIIGKEITFKIGKEKVNNSE